MRLARGLWGLLNKLWWCVGLCLFGAAQSQGAQTILLAGRATTWLDLPEPPYNVAITVKSKLERAGFRVIFDQAQPHDYVLAMTYQETPGPAYSQLESGTHISLEVTLWRVAQGQPQRLWVQRIESSTSWPTPVGSPYWDAVQNLEEDPYYYFLGDLVQGIAVNHEDVVTVFARVLRQTTLREEADTGEGFQAPGDVVANQGARLNAIRELGRLKDPRALPILWQLIEQGYPSHDISTVREQIAAVAAIGDIGDPAASDRLSRLAETTTDPGLRHALEQARARLTEQAHPGGHAK
jgi:hypothetical protein